MAVIVEMVTSATFDFTNKELVLSRSAFEEDAVLLLTLQNNSSVDESKAQRRNKEESSTLEPPFHSVLYKIYAHTHTHCKVAAHRLFVFLKSVPGSLLSYVLFHLRV